MDSPPREHQPPPNPKDIELFTFLSAAQVQAIASRWEDLPKRSSDPVIAMANYQQFRTDKLKHDERSLLSAIYMTPSLEDRRRNLSDEDWRAGIPTIETHDWAASRARYEARADFKFMNGGKSPLPIALEDGGDSVLAPHAIGTNNLVAYNRVKHLLQIRRGVHCSRQLFLDFDTLTTAPAGWFVGRPKRAPLSLKELILRNHGDSFFTRANPTNGGTLTNGHHSKQVTIPMAKTNAALNVAIAKKVTALLTLAGPTTTHTPFNFVARPTTNASFNVAAPKAANNPLNVAIPTTTNTPLHVTAPTITNPYLSVATSTTTDNRLKVTIQTNIDALIEVESNTHDNAATNVAKPMDVDSATDIDTAMDDEDASSDEDASTDEDASADEEPLACVYLSANEDVPTGDDNLMEGVESMSTVGGPVHLTVNERPLAAHLVGHTSVANSLPNVPAHTTPQNEPLLGDEERARPTASLAQPRAKPRTTYRAPSIFSNYARAVLLGDEGAAKIEQDKEILKRLRLALRSSDLPYIMKRDMPTLEDLRSGPFVDYNPLIVTEAGDMTLPELYEQIRGVAATPGTEAWNGGVERLTFSDLLALRSFDPRPDASSSELDSYDREYFMNQGLLLAAIAYEKQMDSESADEVEDVGENVVATNEDATEVDEEEPIPGLDFIHGIDHDENDGDVKGEIIDSSDQNEIRRLARASRREDFFRNPRERIQGRGPSPPSETTVAREPFVKEALKGVMENIDRDPEAAEEAALKYFRQVMPGSGKPKSATADNDDNENRGLAIEKSVATPSPSKVEVRIPRVKKTLTTNLGQISTATIDNDGGRDSDPDFQPDVESYSKPRRNAGSNAKKRKVSAIEPTAEEEAEAEPDSKKAKPACQRPTKSHEGATGNVRISLGRFPGFSFSRQTRQVTSKGTTTLTPTKTPAKTPTKQTTKTPATKSSKMKAAAVADDDAEYVTPRETRRATKQKEEEVKKANVKNRLRGAAK